MRVSLSGASRCKDSPTRLSEAVTVAALELLGCILVRCSTSRVGRDARAISVVNTQSVQAARSGARAEPARATERATRNANLLASLATAALPHERCRHLAATVSRQEVCQSSSRRETWALYTTHVQMALRKTPRGKPQPGSVTLCKQDESADVQSKFV